MPEGGQRYGEALPDQVQGINAVIQNQLSLLDDVRDLIRERAALEKEYAGKLQAIARKAADKRIRTAAARVVGNDPSKNFGDNVLKQNTLENAYAMLIEAYDTSSQDHAGFSEALTAQIAGSLKTLETLKDTTRKKQMAAFDKTLLDRDKTFGDRLRAKQRYDEECIEIETYRQKQGRAADDKHADRAARQYEQQKSEMLNYKNVYLTSIAVANRIKHKYYEGDLPQLENQFQDIQASLVTGLANILRSHQNLHKSTLDGLKYKVDLVDKALAAFDPSKDQDLFIEYNRRPGFNQPGDWVWEPCTSYYDDGIISLEPEPKVLLQNKLARAQDKLDEASAMAISKFREAEQLQSLVVAYQNDPKLGNPDEVMNNYLDASHKHLELSTTQAALEAEVDLISGVLGDDQGARQPHTFKPATFSIPTPCAFCKSSIWGLSKQGKTCKACGISVHAKCELKLPAECQGSSGGGRKHRPTGSVASVKAGNSPSSSRLAVSVPSSSAATPTPTKSAFGPPSAMPSSMTHPKGTILFDFIASSPFELNVHGGEAIELVEDDDGSGWVKVANGQGQRGLVPATYVQLGGAATEAPPPPYIAAATRPRASGKYVKGVYEYTAQGEDELSVQPGVKIELTEVGMSYGDGWSEGIDESGKKGIFPSNYVEPA